MNKSEKVSPVIFFSLIVRPNEKKQAPKLSLCTLKTSENFTHQVDTPSIFVGFWQAAKNLNLERFQRLNEHWKKKGEVECINKFARRIYTREWPGTGIRPSSRSWMRAPGLGVPSAAVTRACLAAWVEEKAAPEDSNTAQIYSS